MFFFKKKCNIPLSFLAAPFLAALCTTSANASFVVPSEELTWPYGVIPYVIDDSVPDVVRQKFFLAVEEYQNNTPIRFLERDADNQHLFPNYKRVVFNPDSPSSHAGSIGLEEGETIVSLGHLVATNSSPTDYGLKTIIHELGHVVGLYHENSRPDMWDYFTIDWDLVADPDCPDRRETNNAGIGIGDYDYFSVMSNLPNGCGVNEAGGPGWNYLTPTDPEVNWSDLRPRDNLHHRLSEGDIAGIDYLYPTPEWLDPGITFGMTNSPLWDYDGIIALVWQEDSDIQVIYEIIDGQAVHPLPGYNRGEAIHFGSGYNVVHINAIEPGEHTYLLVSCTAGDCETFERSLFVAH